MFSTRSPFPRAQATDALIVTHGQPSAPEPPEVALAALAARIDALLPGIQVASATLAMPQRLETEAARLREGGQIFPMFMAAGYFVRHVLPRRLPPDQRFDILPPLGHDPALPELARKALREAAGRRGWPLEQVTVLLAAHGSARGKQAGEDARSFATRLAALMPDTRLVPGFVEEEPFISDAAAGLGDKALCLPLFSAAGGHVKTDIPEGLALAGFGGVLMPVIGDHPDIPGLIAAAIRRNAVPEAAQ